MTNCSVWATSQKLNMTQTQLDAARWKAISTYLVGDRTDLDDAMVAASTVEELGEVVDQLINGDAE